MANFDLGIAQMGTELDLSGLAEGFDQAEREVEGRANVLGGVLKGALTVGLGAAAAGIGAAFGGIAKSLDFAGEVNAAQRQIQASLGLTAAEAQRVGDVAKAVFKNNFGESIGDAANAVVEIRNQLKGLADGELQAATEKALALQDVFGVEVPASANAANALMKQFNLTQAEAFDFIAAGMQKGLNTSGDFLESITEYSTQFGNGGASADQFFSILQTGLGTGVLGTDKAGDLFKEFVVRIQDGSDLTAESLQAIGLNSEQVLSDLASGTIEPIQAFGMVQEALRNTDSEALQMQAGVGLLGTQFEDLGAKAVLGIDMGATKMGDLAGAADSLNAKYGSLSEVGTALWRGLLVELEPVGQSLLGLANDVVPMMLPALQDLGEMAAAGLTTVVDTVGNLAGALIDAGPASSEFFEALSAVVGDDIAGVIVGIADAVQQTVAAIQQAAGGDTSGLLALFPPELQPIVATVVDALANAVPAIQAVVSAVQGAMSGDGGGLTALFPPEVQTLINSVIGTLQTVIPIVQGVVQAIVSNAPTVAAAFLSMFQSAYTAVQTILPPVLAVVTTVIGQITTFLQAHGPQIVSFFQQAYGQLASIVQTAIAIVTTVIQQLTPIVVGVLNGISSFITTHGAQIQSALSSAWNLISGLITTALSVIQGVVTAVLQVLQGNWSGAWTTIQTTAATALTGIVDALRNAANLFGTTLQIGLDAMKALFGGFINDALAFGGNIVGGIVQGIQGAAGQIASTLQNVATSALNAAKQALGIASPSKRFKDEVGAQIGAGTAEGVTESSKQVNAAVTAMSDEALATVRDAAGNLAAAWEDAGAGSPEVLEVIDDIREKAAGLGIDATPAIDNLVATLEDAGPASSEFAEAMSVFDSTDALAQFLGFTTERVELTKEQVEELLSIEQEYQQATKDADAQFYADREAAQRDAAERMADAEDALRLSQLEGRYAFYDAISGMDNQALANQLAAQYEQAASQVGAIAEQYGADVADKWLAAQQSAIQGQGKIQEEIAQAQEEGNAAEVERLNGLLAMRKQADDEKLRQILANEDSIKNQTQAKYDEQAQAYSAQLDKLAAIRNDKIAKLGFDPMQGVVESVERDAPAIADAVGEAVEGAVGALEDGAQQAADQGTELVDNMAAGVEDGQSATADAAAGAVDSAANKARGKLGDFKKTGSDIAKGIAEGVKSGKGMLEDAVREIVRAGLEAGKDEAEIASPSKVAADELGSPIGQGVAVGVEREQATVMDAVTGTLRQALDAAKTTVEPLAGWYGAIGAAATTAAGGIDGFAASIGGTEIPDALVGHSPPPLANWFGFISSSVGDANLGLQDFKNTLFGLKGFNPDLITTIADAITAIGEAIQNVNAAVADANVDYASTYIDALKQREALTKSSGEADKIASDRERLEDKKRNLEEKRTDLLEKQAGLQEQLNALAADDPQLRALRDQSGTLDEVLAKQQQISDLMDEARKLPKAQRDERMKELKLLQQQASTEEDYLTKRKELLAEVERISAASDFDQDIIGKDGKVHKGRQSKLTEAQGKLDAFDRDYRDKVGDNKTKFDDLDTDRADKRTQLKGQIDQITGQISGVKGLDSQIADVSGQLGGLDTKAQQAKDRDAQLAALGTKFDMLAKQADDTRTTIGTTNPGAGGDYYKLRMRQINQSLGLQRQMILADSDQERANLQAQLDATRSLHEQELIKFASQTDVELDTKTGRLKAGAKPKPPKELLDAYDKAAAGWADIVERASTEFKMHLPKRGDPNNKREQTLPPGKPTDDPGSSTRWGRYKAYMVNVEKANEMAVELQRLEAAMYNRDPNPQAAHLLQAQPMFQNWDATRPDQELSKVFSTYPGGGSGIFFGDGVRWDQEARKGHDWEPPAIDGARATGGPVSRGSLYLVGERGRELFMPTTDGAIATADETEALLNLMDRARAIARINPFTKLAARASDQTRSQATDMAYVQKQLANQPRAANGCVTNVFHIDARGSTMSAAEYRRITEQVVDEKARAAKARTRT